MFTTDELMEHAREICDKFNISYPEKITYNSRLRTTWGRRLFNTTTKTGYIELNPHFCKINRDEIVIGLLKHELVHMVHHNHGPGFNKLCAKMGIKSCTHDTFNDINEPELKYRYMCPTCNRIYNCNRTFKYGASCPNCHPGEYSEKYKLIKL